MFVAITVLLTIVTILVKLIIFCIKFTIKLTKEPILDSKNKSDIKDSISKVAEKGVGIATKVVAKTTLGVVKVVLKFVISIVGSIGLTAALVVTLVLSTVILVGTVVLTVIEDIDTSKLTTETQESFLSNGSDYEVVTNMDLMNIDMERLDFKITNSNHKGGIRTKVRPENFTEVALLLVNGESGFDTYSNRYASRYIGYIFGSFHGSVYYMDTKKYVESMNGTLIKSTSNDYYRAYLKKEASTSEEYRSAGLPIKESNTVFMDCSGFIAWIYATVFTAYDGNNAEIDTLANWFSYSLSSSDYVGGFNCRSITFSDVRAGDVLVRSGHVGLAISNSKYIHASQEKNGINISEISGSNFTRAYRPNIDFSE